MRSLLFFLVFSLLLVGCAGRTTVSENQCTAGDWQTLGYRDGVNGHRSSRLLQHQDACVRHGIVPDRAGYMVGWEEGITYEVKKVGGWKSTMLSGEGLVVNLTGPGRIYLQTRSPNSFIDWLVPKLPTQRS